MNLSVMHALMQVRHRSRLPLRWIVALVMTFLQLGLVWGNLEALTVDRIIATVNNEIVLLSDYQKFVHKYAQDSRKEGIDEGLLRNLLEEKIIYLEARKQGFDATDGEVAQSISEFQKRNALSPMEFEKRLADEGMSMQDYKTLLKENIISLKLINRDVDSRVKVSDRDIALHYNDNRGLFAKTPEKMQVKAIFLKLSEAPTLTEVTDLKIKSLKIHDELSRGDFFERMVAQHAEEFLKARDGLLGEFEKGELLPELDSYLQNMREGEISSPLWTKEGVYILKLTKKIRSSHIPIEEVRDSIYTTLYTKKREELYNIWISKLWSKSSVKVRQ